MGSVKLSSPGSNVKQLSDQTQPQPESSKLVRREDGKKGGWERGSEEVGGGVNDADSTLGYSLKTFVLH